MNTNATKQKLNNGETVYGAFFRTPKLNVFVGKWVSGAIAHVPLDLYRRYHLDHHKFAGTPDDPDKWMVKAYPVTRESLKRKLIRDVTGQTGFRDLLGEVLLAHGVLLG